MKLKNGVSTDANLQKPRLAGNQIVSGGTRLGFLGVYNRTKLYTIQNQVWFPLIEFDFLYSFSLNCNLVSVATPSSYFHGVGLGPLSKILAVIRQSFKNNPQMNI